jgi:formate dehydrogenase subunit gamma
MPHTAARMAEVNRETFSAVVEDKRLVKGGALLHPGHHRNIPGEKMPQLAQWDRERAREIVVAHAHLDGPAIPILHALQEEFGFIADEAVPLIASVLNLSRAEVHGVLTFYHDFRRQPAGRHVLKICRAEACQSMGAVQVADEALRREGLDWGGTTSDGALTIEPVYCLGLCACAPAALYDDEPVARVDRAKLETLSREARRA